MKFDLLEYMEKFEELLDEVISKGNGEDFEKFKKRVIERLDDIE